MKNRCSQLLSYLLAFALVCSSIATPVYAQESPATAVEVAETGTEEVSADTSEEPAAAEETKEILPEEGKEETESVLPEEGREETESVLPEESKEETNILPEETEIVLDEMNGEAQENDVPIEVGEDDADREPAPEPEEHETPKLTYHAIPGEGEYESIREHLPKDSRLVAEMAALESKYNPVEDAAYLPAIRNQDPYGSCWAHSIIGAGEIGLAKNKEVDPKTLNLSELQMAYFMYNSPKTDPLGLVDGDSNMLGDEAKDSFMDIGGNVNLAKKIMQGWICAGDDAGELAYSEAETVLKNGLDDAYAFDDIYHLENYYNVNIAKRDEAKRAIKEYGALTVSYYHDNNYSYTFFKSETNSYESSYYFDGGVGTNHAVLAVGWDDDYPRDNFGREPVGDGAWLIRNSWGGSDSGTYGIDGYFWMSYYDTSLVGGVAVELEPADKYTNNYHYDGAAGDSTYPFSSGSKIANVFTAQGDSAGYEMLEAVSFDTDSTNVIYHVEIYTGLTDSGDPESGTKVAEAEGVTTYVGYYTVPLDNFVPLSKGDVFSVVVTSFHADDSDVYIPFESDYNYGWVKGTAGSHAGESFYNLGSKWVDYGADGDGNFRIKAFTKCESEKVDATGITFGEDPFTVTLAYGDRKAVGAKTVPNNATDKRMKWTSSDETVVTVSGGLLTAVGVGEATVTAALLADETITASCSVRVLPSLKIVRHISFDYSDCVYGSTHELTISFSPENLRSDYTFVWGSSDTSVVTVSEEGVLKAVGKGTAEVTLKTKENIELVDSITVNVNRLEDVDAQIDLADDFSSMMLSWKAVTGAERYKVYLYEFDDNWWETLLKTEETKELSCQIEYQLSRDIFYGYKIVAYSADGTMRSDSSGYNYFKAAPKHKLTYVLNGGTNHKDNPSEIFEGDPLLLLFPTRTGYIFSGWYTDAEFKNRFTGPMNITEDMTFYARWIANSYYIIYDGNGATDGKMSQRRLQYDKEATLDPVKYTLKGYAFECWNTDRYGNGTSYADEAKVLNLTDEAEARVRLYAIWSFATYKIEYELNGGTNHADNPASYNINDENITLKDPVREGYEFGGWYDQEDFSGTAVTVIDTQEGIDRKLYAKWIGNHEITDSPEDKDDSDYEDEKRIDLKTTAGGAIATDFPGKTYDGLPYKPAVKVTARVNGRTATLTEGTDYRVLYENNIQAGTGKVIVKGNGIYKGELSKNFTIWPKSIAGLKAVAGGMALKSAAEIPVYVYDGSKLLAEGVDYKLTAPAGMTSTGGTKSVTVTAVAGSNYTGQKSVEVTVYDSDKVLDAAGVTLSYSTAPFTGKALKPAVTVKLGGSSLDKSCYTVKYTNNKNAGTALVTVTGKKGCSGCVVKTFEITAVKGTFSLKKAISSVTYNGKPLKPKVVVKAGKKTLKAGKDYTINYANNLHATGAGGRAKAIVHGIGNYAGAVDTTFEFTIKPQKISKVKVSGTQNNLKVTYGTRQLQEGKDFTVSYDSDPKGGVKVTLKAVEGKDFTGTANKKLGVAP